MDVNAEQTPKSDVHPRAGRLARALALFIGVPLLFLGCGQAALLLPASLTSARPDTRSQLRAEYGPWPFIVVAPLDPRIIDEIREDQERYPEVFGDPISRKSRGTPMNNANARANRPARGCASDLAVFAAFTSTSTDSRASRTYSRRTALSSS